MRTALAAIDNSPTEREFQDFAKLHLDRLFASSPDGAPAPASALAACAGSTSGA